MGKQNALDVTVSFDPYYGEPGRDGNQGYEIHEDGTVSIRIKAPFAKECRKIAIFSWVSGKIIAFFLRFSLFGL